MTARRVHRFATQTLGALGLAVLIAAAGCASENARFYTELTQPGKLSAGSRVVNLGSPIGLVASISPLADGNAGAIRHSAPRTPG